MPNKVHQPYVSKQLTTAVSVAIIIGLLAMYFVYIQVQRSETISSNEQAMTQLTESIMVNLHSIMVSGYADIASDFVDGLKTIPRVSEVQITKTDGSQAFLDNKTIEKVNKITGEESFFPRDTEEFVQIIPPDDPKMEQAILTRKIVQYYEQVGDDYRLTFLAPIENTERCHTCHSDNHNIRGLLKVSTSQLPVQQDIAESRLNTGMVFLVTTMIIIVATLFLIYETLIFPLNKLTGAMKAVADGRMHLRAPINGDDELTEIARNFNVMIQRIQQSYDQLSQEQNKLLSIVHTNQEGVVCADESGIIVLVNPAACRILKEDEDAIIGQPLENCFGQPDLVDHWFSDSHIDSSEHQIELGKRTLRVYANNITSAQNKHIGRSLRFEDITEELEIRHRLQQLSVIDSLTGLYNRRYFDANIETEIKRSQKDGNSLSMLMMDIDHFKMVNDTHGHDIGDKVLIDLAKLIKQSVRLNDIASRFGGEEFSILLPETSMESALKLAERIRSSVETESLGGIQITTSIGVSCLDQTAQFTADELMKLADTELYRAKKSGRNQVCYKEDLA